MFGHYAWDTHGTRLETFNAFSDEATAKTDDPSIQSISQDIEIPVWTVMETPTTLEEGERPVEKFERTFQTPIGSIVQHKEIVHPDPSKMGEHPTFDVTIHSVLTTDDDTPSNTLTDTVVNPTPLVDGELSEYGIWELSGLDEWLSPETDEEEGETDETDETEEIDETVSEPEEEESGSKIVLWILAGLGVSLIGMGWYAKTKR
jgi:hypothetical protein